MEKEEFGKYLRKLRKDRDLTLVELSKITGVSNPYISQIENGKFTPSPEVLTKISKGLGVADLHLMIKAGYLDQELSSIEGDVDMEKIISAMIEDEIKILQSVKGNNDDNSIDIKISATKRLLKLEEMRKKLNNINHKEALNSHLIEGTSIDDYQENKSNFYIDNDLSNILFSNDVYFFSNKLTTEDKVKIVRLASVVLSEYIPPDLKVSFDNNPKSLEFNLREEIKED